ncbi:MAG: glycosyltransferase family 4 protein [Candidatus Sericytochromatia bacterium]
MIISIYSNKELNNNNFNYLLKSCQKYHLELVVKNLINKENNNLLLFEDDLEKNYYNTIIINKLDKYAIFKKAFRNITIFDELKDNLTFDDIRALNLFDYILINEKNKKDFLVKNFIDEKKIYLIDDIDFILEETIKNFKINLEIIETIKNKKFSYYKDLISFKNEYNSLKETDIYKKIEFILSQAEEISDFIFFDAINKIEITNFLDFIKKETEFNTSYGVSTPQEEGSGGYSPVPHETPEQSSEVFSNKNKKIFITFYLEEKTNIEAEFLKTIKKNFYILQEKTLFSTSLKLDGFKLLVFSKEKQSISKKFITWEGNQFLYNSLSVINRELEVKIIESNKYNLSIINTDTYQEIKAHNYKFYDELKKRVAKVNLFYDDFYIRNCLPENLPFPENGYYILIFPWETGKIPENIITHINLYVDRVWCISEHVKNMLIAQKIIPSKLAIIPCGLNSELYNTKYLLKSNIAQEKKAYKIENILKEKKAKKFKFIFVGGILYRKGIDILIQAYIEEFKNNEEVSLIIKSFGNNSYYKAESLINSINSKIDKKNLPDIILIDENLTVEEIAFLYQNCDCYVQPYRAEGFCMPLAEAVACGLNIITTGFGPAKEFCPPETTLFLDYTEIEDYAEVDKNDLKNKMRKVFESEKNQALLLESSNTILKNYSWENILKLIEKDFEIIIKKPIYRNNLELIKNNLAIELNNYIKSNIDFNTNQFNDILLELEFLAKLDSNYFNILGDSYFYKKDYDKAIEYYLNIEEKNTDILEKLNFIASI